jgi:hypothetical protein
MITPSFGLTATERVLPRMALDFTTASLDSRVTFTRSGDTATVINSSGLVASINADLPRFDFNLNTGGVCKGLLIEEARTNIAPYSKEPANWFKAGTATVSGTGETSPDGTSNAFAISACEGNANRFSAAGALTVTGGSTVTFSVYLKANGNGTGAVLKLASAGGIYTEATSAVTITNEWARYSFSMTTNVTNTGVFWIVYGDTGTTALVPWGVQVEVGAFATSFIPTTGLTTSTRNADVATMTGTNFSDWFNASEGAFTGVAQTLSAAGSTQRIFSASTGSFADAVSATTSGVDLYCQTFNGGALQANLYLAGTANQTDFKFNSAYKAASFAASRNASALQTSTGTIPTVNQLGIGNEGGFALFNGHLKQLRYYPQRLINAEVQAFSKG